MNHRTIFSLLSAASLLLGASTASAQDTVFFTGFEYDLPPAVFEPADLNGADDQVGEWSGDEFPEGRGDILNFNGIIDTVGIVPSPFGGNLMVLDRPSGDLDGEDLTGSYFADLTSPVGLLGAEVSFNVGTRRTGGNNEKDYDIIGRDSNGTETFHLRVGTNNGSARRLGVVTEDGATVTFDLPTVEGDDRHNDINNMGGFNKDDGPNLSQEITNILLRMGEEGYVVEFSYPEESTSPDANAYRTALLEYNGAGVDLAQLEFTYEASDNDGRNSGYVLDNVLVTGFDDLLQGDFNFDGTINESDYLVFSDNFGTGTTYAEGDFNFDGSVTVADFVGLKAAAMAQTGQAAAVPEPAGAFLLLAGVGVLLGARHRRRQLSVALGLLLAIGLSLSTPSESFAQPGELIGTGTESLLGGDLTDPEDDGEADEDLGYNAIFRSNLEPGFGGGEFSFNVFDNLLGPGNAKWCCGDNTLIMEPEGLWVEAEIEGLPVVLTHFTVSSANDVPGRDPIRWAVLGSNDGINYDPIFEYDEGESLWPERLQVRKFTGGSSVDDYALPEAYKIFRLATYETGSTTFQIGEIEFFGSSSFTPGDFNDDGSVDRLDYEILRDNFGESVASASLSASVGDFNGDLIVDVLDFAGFREIYNGTDLPASVPEPNASVLFSLAICALSRLRRRR